MDAEETSERLNVTKSWKEMLLF